MPLLVGNVHFSCQNRILHIEVPPGTPPEVWKLEISNWLLGRVSRCNRVVERSVKPIKKINFRQHAIYGRGTFKTHHLDSMLPVFGTLFLTFLGDSMLTRYFEI